MQVLVWLTETTTGDLTELNVSGGGQLFVDRIRNRNRTMHRDEQLADYYSRHIQASAKANFIITNHAMLLADLNRTTPLFTSQSGLIVDEAHQFVQTASRHDEIVFSYTNWKYVMGQMGSDSEGQLVHELFKIANKLAVPLTHKIDALMETFTQFTESFDRAIGALAHDNPKSEKDQQGNRKVFPLTRLKHLPAQFSKVATAMARYIDQAEAIDEALRIHHDNMTREQQCLLSEWSYWIREIKIKAGQWVELFLTMASKIIQYGWKRQTEHSRQLNDYKTHTRCIHHHSQIYRRIQERANEVLFGLQVHCQFVTMQGIFKPTRY